MISVVFSYYTLGVTRGLKKEDILKITDGCFGPVAGILLVIGAGGVGLSHINDSRFWIVKEYFGMSVQDTFKTWTLSTTIASIVAFAGAIICSVFL